MAKKIKKYRPVEPLNKKMFIELGLSIDPRDIPAERGEKSIILRTLEDKAREKESVLKEAEDKYNQEHGGGGLSR